MMTVDLHHVYTVLCVLQLCKEHDVPGFVKFKMFDAKRK